MSIYGYFDDRGIKPAHDPGLDVDCPICHTHLSAPMRTISLLPQRPNVGRSYFYRVHAACYAAADSATIEALDNVEPRAWHFPS